MPAAAAFSRANASIGSTKSVARTKPPEVAIETAKALLLETPRLWQSSYAAAPRARRTTTRAFKKAQAWLFQNFKRMVRLEELAARVGMSPRTFARRFREATGNTPREYIQRVRIEAAKRLLEHDRRPVGEIARRVGYGDPVAFRKLFVRETGLTPADYRARYGPRSSPSWSGARAT